MSDEEYNGDGKWDEERKICEGGTFLESARASKIITLSCCS